MSTSTWHNWSGVVQCRPSRMIYPQSHRELVHTVQECVRKKSKIRVVGAGHSWNPLCHTDQTMVSLRQYTGIESLDATKRQATVYAGTSIRQLGDLLFKHGLGLENQGDIDVQSIAGAISTGTHGTGLAFGSLSTQVVGLTLITATGDELHCSPSQNPEIFKAAQVSLGTLGIISKVTLQCVPAYKLHYRSGKENVHQCLDNLEKYNAENRNFEFYWFPHTDTVQTKFSNTTDAAPQGYSAANYLNDYVLENGVYGAMSAFTLLMPSATSSISRLSVAALSPTSKTDWSHKVYATPRLVKFQEMEYNVPLDRYKEAFLEVLDCYEEHHFRTHFPLEHRFGPAEDIYLSSAYGRASAHISVHTYKGQPYRKYFDALAAIFRNHGGRPHWAKLHTLTADELRPLYPMWDKFLAIRQELDPNGLFLNGYLRQLFGIPIKTK